MNLSDEVMTLTAIRETQMILADYIQPGPRDAEKTIDRLSILERGDVVEAVDRLEAGAGMRMSQTQEAVPPRRMTRLLLFTLKS